jgi:hypothetical protein
MITSTAVPQNMVRTSATYLALVRAYGLSRASGGAHSPLPRNQTQEQHVCADVHLGRIAPNLDRADIVAPLDHVGNCVGTTHVQRPSDRRASLVSQQTACRAAMTMA